MAYSISYIIDLQDKYSQQLKKIATATKEFEKAVNKTNKSLKKLAANSKKMGIAVTNSTKEVSRAVTDLSASMGKLDIKYDGAIQSANKYVTAANKVSRANKKANTSGNKFTRGLAKLEKKLATAGYKFNNFGSIAGTVGGTVIAKDVIGTFTDFDYTMNSLQAVMEMPIEQMGRFRDVAKELGRTTPYKASEVAASMQQLAMAGLKPKQILEAIPGTLDLAAASGMELAKSANVVTDTMAQTQQGTGRLTHINNVFAKATTMSKLTMDNLAEAMVPVATTATNLGIPFEQLVSMLGIMANRGERGANGATLLRNALARTAGPSVKAMRVYKHLGINIGSYLDSMGKLKNFPRFIHMLRGLQKQGKMTVPVLKALFEERGYRSIQILMGSARGEIKQFEETLKGVTDTSAIMARTKLRGLPGVLMELKSVIEALKISFVESGIDEILINWGRSAKSLMYSMSKLNPVLLKWTGILVGLGMAAAGLVTIMGILSASFSAILALLGPALVPLGTFLGGVTAPIWGLIAGIATLVTGLVYAYKRSSIFRAALSELGREFSNLWYPISEVVKIIFSTDNVVKGAGSTIGWFGKTVISGLTQTVWLLTDVMWLLTIPFKVLGKLIEAFRKKGFSGIFTPVIEQVKSLTAWIGTLLDKFSKLIGLKDSITGAPTKAFAMTKEMLTTVGGKVMSVAKMATPDIATPLRNIGSGIEKSLGVGPRPSTEIIKERDQVISNMLYGNIKIDVDGPGKVAESVIKSTAPGNLGFSMGQ